VRHGIKFSCQANAFSITLSVVEWRIFAIALQRAIPQDGNSVQQVFLWPDSLKPKLVERDVLLSELRVVQDELDKDYDRLTAIYAGTRYDNDGNVHSSGVGAFGGLRLRRKGDSVYLLQFGIGECYLEEQGPLAQNEARLPAVIDCRDETIIESENLGIIKIRRRRINTKLSSTVHQLIDFLSGMHCKLVSINAG
jgi:hypothetical protein